MIALGGAGERGGHRRQRRRHAGVRRTRSPRRASPPSRRLHELRRLVADANLAFLGDVFALPAWMPAANVFSVGDLLLALGAAIFVHAACGSRLAPRARLRVAR